MGFTSQTLLVPSGVEYATLDLALLRMMAECGFIRWSEEPFTLRSGIESHVYVFGREDLTDNPDLSWLVGQKLCHFLTAEYVRRNERRMPNLIGIPVAGTALAAATSFTSEASGYITPCSFPRMNWRLMREYQKAHGAHKDGFVYGKPNPERYWHIAIDNVVTNGKSKEEAAEHFDADGYDGKGMTNVIFIERQQGGIARLRAKGFTDLLVVYNLLDITFAYRQLDLWPVEALAKVEAEIKAHQFSAT